MAEPSVKHAFARGFLRVPRTSVAGIHPLLLVALALSAVAIRAEERGVWLKYSFEPGQTLTMAVEHRAVTDTTIAGERQSVETSTDSRKVWRVVAIDAEGRATIEHSVADVAMTSRSSDRGELRWKSGDAAAPPPGYEGVAESLGKPLARIVIDPFGRVLKRHDLRPAATSRTGDFLVVPLPDHPVKVGEEWSVPQEVVVEAPKGPRKAVKTRLRYRLAEVRDGLAEITVDTTVLTPVDDPRLEAQLLERVWDGRVVFDVHRGRVERRTTEADRTVIGFAGPNSSMHYKAELDERRIDDAPKPSAEGD